jgi:capsular exopolysaccharide synthesis family protein
MVPAWRARTTGGHLALVEDPTSPHAEAYRTLRTAIQFLSIDEPKHVFGITSSVPDEGKTTTVANLAVSFARAGQRVIVVSCDLRRPKLHVFFGDTGRTGLTSVLLGDASLNEAVHPVENEPRLRVMPSGPLAPNPAEILSLDKVRQVIDALADNSDILLLDCPPVLPVTDALLLSRLVDGMLIVTSAKTTSKRDLRRSFDLLDQVHARVLGTIINRVPVDGGAAYGYGYGYYDYAYDYAPDAREIGALSSRAAADPLPAGDPLEATVGVQSLAPDEVDPAPVPAPRLAQRDIDGNGQSAAARSSRVPATGPRADVQLEPPHQ